MTSLIRNGHVCSQEMGRQRNLQTKLKLINDPLYNSERKKPLFSYLSLLTLSKQNDD